ncbi:unnamed protein product [Arctogadus glacialis]
MDDSPHVDLSRWRCTTVAVGSRDCSQCWGREGQGHLCGWCDNSCRPRDDCQPITDQCPAPEIHKISPLSGPVEGGTLVTVQGRNLGKRASVVDVSIGGVACSLLPDRYSVSVELVCVTGGSGSDFVAAVRVSVLHNGEGKSDELFSYLRSSLGKKPPLRCDTSAER